MSKENVTTAKSASNLRLLYLRDSKTMSDNSRGAPIGCVLFELSKDKRTISYAMSACSPRDSFDKKIAVKIANNRFNAKPSIIQLPEPAAGYYDVRIAIMQDIKNNNQEDRKRGATEKYGRSFIALMSARGWMDRAAKPSDVKKE